MLFVVFREQSPYQKLFSFTLKISSVPFLLYERWLSKINSFINDDWAKKHKIEKMSLRLSQNMIFFRDIIEDPPFNLRTIRQNRRPRVF